MYRIGWSLGLVLLNVGGDGKSTGRFPAARLIARTEELELLAAGRREGLAILEGWRFDQFGRDALDLVEGRLAFGVKGGKLLMTHTEVGQ